jgi:hypothetical protein
MHLTTRTLPDADTVREHLEEIPIRLRAPLARRLWYPVQDALASCAGQLRVTERECRRVVSALTGRPVPDEETAVHRPLLEAKERAILLELVAAVGLDLVANVAVTRWLTKLGWPASLATGVILGGLTALLAGGAGVIDVPDDRLQDWLPGARRVASATWVVVLAGLSLIYALRGGLGSLSWVVLVLTAQNLALGVLTRVLSGLHHAYRGPRLLWEFAENLRAKIADLKATREVLSEHLGRSGEPPLLPGPNGNGDRGAVEPLRPRPRRRLASRGIAVGIAMLGLVACLTVVSGPARAAETRRFGISLDVSDTGDQSAEYGRVVRVIAGNCSTLVESLGDVDEVQVLRWDDAESVLSAGTVFELPGARTESTGEGSLPFFNYAARLEAEREAGRLQALCRPMWAEIAREITEPPTGLTRQSCCTAALMRAVERPSAEVWLVVTDFEDYQCPAPSASERGGARVLTVLVPRHEGAASRERLEARLARLRMLFPDITVVPSWEADSPSGLRALVTRVSRASEGEDGR